MKRLFKPVCILLPSLVLAACGSNDHAPKIVIDETSYSAIATTHLVVSAEITDEDNDLDSIKWEQVKGPGTTEFIGQTIGSNKVVLKLPYEAGKYTYTVTATDKENLKNSRVINVDVNSLEEEVFNPLSTLLETTFAANQDVLMNMSSLIDFGNGIVWQDAVGITNANSQQVMTPQHQYRIASISKTVSAAVTFKLIEQGLFTLDTPLSELLNDSDMPTGFTIDDLHQKAGSKHGSSITVRQLLDQSTGIEDFVSYLEDVNAPDTRAFIKALTQQNNNVPDIWTSDLIVQELLERGLTQNLNSMPGEAYLYGNSNTDLLAWTLEQFTGESFETLLEEHVFVPLDMQQTYMDYHQAKKGAGPVEHLFLVETDAPEYQLFVGNHNIMALDVNTSFAWAGGGLVSTLEDLNKFFKALTGDEYIKNEALRKELNEHWRKVSSEEEDQAGYTVHYGLALEKNTTLNYQTIGHSGFWGAYASHVTPLDVYIYSWAGQPSSDAAWVFQEAAIKLLHSKGIKGTNAFKTQ